MSLIFAVAIYFVTWWIVLFAILPWGVKTQEEAGEVIPGTAESAPVTPNLRAKLLATTIAATVVFALIYWLVAGSGITLDDIPFLPRFERVGRS